MDSDNETEWSDDPESEWDGNPPYHDGHMHVMSEQCSTCVLRPGNLMRLPPGRVAGMVRGSIAKDGAYACHQSLPTEQHAICRGFWDLHGDRITGIRLAKHKGIVKELPPPHRH